MLPSRGQISPPTLALVETTAPGDLVAGPTDFGEALGRLTDQFVAASCP